MKNQNQISISKLALYAFVFTIVLALTGSAAEVKQEILSALSAHDTTTAISLLEKEIALDPSFEQNYYMLGLIYKKQNKIAKAEEQFLLSIDKNKNFWPGVYELGKAQLLLGKIKEAEKNFTTGLKKGRKYKGEFLNGMGLLHIAKGEYDKADTELRKAIVQDGNNSEYHTNLGDANYNMGVWYTAISEYEKALQLDTASLEVYYRWAEACIEMSDYKCALEKLAVVLQKDSTYADAWFRAGGIYYKAARSSRNVDEIKELYGKTIGAYTKFIELSKATPDSVNGRAYFEMGKSYLLLGGYAEANQYIRNVLSIPIIPKDIYFYYGRSFHGMSENPEDANYDSAIVYYNKQIEWAGQQGADFVSGVGDDELYRRIGECYEVKKDRFNTIKYYKKSLEYDPNQARLLYGVAVAYNYVQDYRNALIYYNKRIEQGIDERYWSIYYNAATSALYLAEQGGTAVMEEDEDLMLDGDMGEEPVVVEDPFVGVDLADMAIGYLEKIVNEYWSKVEEKESNMKIGLRALNLLGSTYLYQKSDCANGVKYFERLLELEPNNCEANKSLGFAYYGGICPENYTKAISYLKKALDCQVAAGDSRCKDPDLLLWLGQVYENRAFAKNEAKQSEEAKADYKIADDYYLECSECAPNNQEAKDGHRRVKWEHN
ncbi:MAG: tetratricopeptide repeat protein [Candidatus Zixiibacteriota bacterium]